VWPTSLKKPVLYPIRTAKGTLITRGFPLDPRPGERVDHPHHVGLWFNYGDVNGIDFWNNSDAIPPSNSPRWARSFTRRLAWPRADPARGSRSGTSCGSCRRLGDPERAKKYVFSGSATTRTIDRITTLTAGATRVDLKDNKEGVLGLRVTRALEEPSTKPEVFTMPQVVRRRRGHSTTRASTGVYLTSEGKQGAAAWGTRGKWTTLSGKVGDEPVSIAIFDAPGNPGYPTYWHARGYGLFAANPLGQKELSEGKDVLNFAIEPNKSVTFKHASTS
jgi:hypothetical protein